MSVKGAGECVIRALSSNTGRAQIGRMMAALVCVWSVCMGPAQAAGAGARRDRPGSIDAAIAARWQPLRVRSGAPAYARAELKKAYAASVKGHNKKACVLAEKLRTRLMSEAAALFYAPNRTPADLSGVRVFMQRYVHGRAPLLAIAKEVFVPSPAWRNLAVQACMAAGRPDIAARFVDQVALASSDLHLRTAAAVIRMANGSTKAQVGWLVGRQGGGARAWLIRAYGAPSNLRAQLLQKARQTADFGERQDIAVVAEWIARQPSGPVGSR